MGLEREVVNNFSELDAEKRIMLIIEYIKVLRSGYIEHSIKTLDNSDVNIALKKAYGMLEKEFDK